MNMAELQTIKRPIRSGKYPELTLTAVIVGLLVGSVITVSIGYACLILGFSIEGSELAAILGFGILRGVLRRSSIVENNINQTIASSVNGASAGMMFTVPALFILNETNFNPVLLVFSCIAGGILGISFIIPLRKQMIDFERLTYPGGVAVATILKSPGAGISKAIFLMLGIVLSGAAHFLVQFFSLIKESSYENFDLGAFIGLPNYMNGILLVSLMTIGVGFIAGKGGFSFLIGGFACYWILAPVLNSMGLLPSAGDIETMGIKGMPDYLRTILFRPLGIGMLIGGALTGIVLAFPLIRSAIKSMVSAKGSKLSKDEMPIKLLYIGIIGAAIALFITAILSTSEVGILRGILMAIFGTVWIWVAGVILSECIGRTNWSPLSGMTLIAVTVLIVICSGMANSASIIASITVGAATCVAMAQATDLMMDMKTGYLVGASPRMQGYAQLLGVWLGPILVMVMIFVLHEAYGLGSEKLPAPQGQVLASMIQGIQGGDIPLNKYIAGTGLGILLSSSGIGGLGILVGLGFYLPFNIVLTYAIGTFLRIFVDWKKGKKFSEETGIPIAAGLIVGEALVGVGFALYFVFSSAGS